MPIPIPRCHKRTFAVQNGMSALPPIADMCGATRYVRFVPKADILRREQHVETLLIRIVPIAYQGTYIGLISTQLSDAPPMEVIPKR